MGVRLLSSLIGNAGSRRSLLRIRRIASVVPVIALGGAIVSTRLLGCLVLRRRRRKITIGCRRIAIDQGTEIIRRPTLILSGRGTVIVNLRIDGWIMRDVQHGTGSRKGTCIFLSKDRASLCFLIYIMKTIS